MKGKGAILVRFIVLFLSLSLAQNLPAGGQLSVDSESKISNPQLENVEFAQKKHKL